MKTGTNIHHVKGNCWTGFQCQRSQVKAQQGEMHFSGIGIPIDLRMSIRYLCSRGIWRRRIYIALYYKLLISKALRYVPRVTTGSHSFTCHPHTNHTCLYSPAARHHRIWLVPYSLCLPTKGWPGWVNLGGWSHTEINVPHRELNPDTVTHPSTNRARHWLTSLIKANALTTTPDHQPYRSMVWCWGWILRVTVLGGSPTGSW